MTRVFRSLCWRFRLLPLFARAFLALILARGARRIPAHIRTILILQNAKMGDMVCTTPLIRAAKRAFPAARIVVAGDAVNGALLAGNPHMDEYLVYPGSMSAFIPLLRRLAPDVTILALPGPDALAALALSRAPLIIAPRVVGGTSPFQTLAYRLLLRLVRAVPHRAGAYGAREYLRLLEPLGIMASDTTKELSYSSDAAARVEAFFHERGIDPSRSFLVGITPSAGNKVKLWPAERFAGLARHLYERYGATVFITGAERDRPEVEAMRRALGDVPAVDTLGMFNVEEYKAFVARLHLFVSVDTGSIYIAEAFGVATLDIVGPVDAHDQPPSGEFHMVVEPPRAAPAMTLLANIGYDPAEVRRQSTATTLEAVVEAADTLIARLIRAGRIPA